MTITVSCYLIKEGFTPSFHYTIENDHLVTHENSLFDIDVTTQNAQIEAHIARTHKVTPKVLQKATSPYQLYYRNATATPPDWVTFWSSESDVQVRTADAIAILPVNEKLFAVCHGHSSHFLNPFAVDLRFGLKTALNLIDFDSIRSADLFTPSEVNLRTRKQSTSDTRFHDYDVNVFNTILKNIAGRVRDEHKELCQSIQGSANLRFSHSGNADELSDKLSSILVQYGTDYYRSNGFEWIDHFSPVVDRTRLAEHNAKLVDALNSFDSSIHLYVPSSLNFAGLFDFRFKSLGERSRRMFQETDIENSLYSSMRDNDVSFDSIDAVKKVKLEVVDHADKKHVIDHFPLSSCLYFENRSPNSLVFLEEGSWYSVDEQFQREIDATVDPLLAEANTFPIEFDKNALRNKYWGNEKKKPYENWFNRELAESILSSGNACELLDLKLVPSFGQGKVEICDVLYQDNDGMRHLIHNKYKYGSSALSHLFSQGNVSATLLTDAPFRVNVNNAVLSASSLQFPGDHTYNPENYTVTYGIISPPDTVGQLPFFSKINLRVFHDNLRRMRYPVRIAFITDQTRRRAT